MGFEPPVLDHQHGMPQQDRERRSYARRREDQEHGNMLPAVVSVLVSICGGLAVLFLFFAAMGAVDVGDAIVATVIAVVMGLVWFAGFYYRHRTHAERAQWRDRERRGF
jgi:O-antigen/teichoic acid export membrane protein